MNNKTYRDILDSAAADSLSRTTNLMPKISARLERKPLMTSLRTRPLLALLIAILILFALSGAVYALGRAFGYIPGIGLVDQDAPIQVLAEPVSQEQQGISVTISRVVADSTRTFISYQVDGIPFVENELPACLNTPELRLPDGTSLENQTGSGGTPVLRNGEFLHYATEEVYSPIPGKVSEVTFVLSCTLPQETDAQEWRLLLKLSPAPANFATPVVEAGATYSAFSPVRETPSTLQSETAKPRGSEPTLQKTPANLSMNSGFSLDQVLELPNSYVLIGKFTDAGDLGGPLYMTTSSDSDYMPHIEDANGNPIPFKVRDDLRPDPDWDVAYYFAYEIPRPVTTPLKLTVDQVNLRKHNTAQTKFDTGDNPQAGQEWKLDQPVKLGESEFVVNSIVFLGNGYQFNLSAGTLPAGVAPDIEIVDRTLSPYQFEGISSRVDNSKEKGVYTLTLTTPGLPPTGPLTINWGLEEYIPISGPWSLVWTP
jgi:hypothetical protein